VKFFSRFILHRAGRLEQLDHSQNPSHFFFLLGRSPGTIRPLVNPFRILFFPPGKLPGTIRPFFSKKKTNKKNQSKEKRKGFHAYFSLQNLLFRVKRK
jgi:hypothetical protein